jgi:hypothetical protein
MSDQPFMLPPPPLMTAEKARDTARAYKALATHLSTVGYASEATRMERDSAWWLAYSLTLAATKPDVQL